ncbi:hypothetical protein ACP70R_002229 [Stipagrostis hirtigluma subsp. patula]
MAAGGGAGRRTAPAAAVTAAVPAAAEAAADEVVRRVRPTEASERRRAEVVDFVRMLVGTALGCEVFVFGSVPLKTYLPDGDIDLTVLGNTSHDSTLIKDVNCVLKSEEQNADAELEVKDLDLINAEVKLIKCTIGNIIVDISFNQTGGISALCFLELVDRKVGKNHLFKRSIILIKAWCYYESRLLGAHHGLISTYALEILILYIFNLFHKTLCGPLEVLYRFLEYFSKFDWDNYCISLNGPVALSSLPNLIVEDTVTHADDLLFDKEFLKCSLDKAFAPERDSDACYTRFRPKHLNIIDPLKEYNNLGRSVNRASFHRIRTAFSYGAQKLGQILTFPSELVPDEIYGFFKNTLARNERGLRPDIGSDGALHPSLGSDKALLEDVLHMKISYKEDENGTPYLSKSMGNNNSNVKRNGPTHFASCFPDGNNIASNAYLSAGSSHFVHHAPGQDPSFYQENGNAFSEKCYVDHEMEQVSHYSVKAFHVHDRSSIHSQVCLNDQSHTLKSSDGGNTLELTNGKKSCADHVEKEHIPPSSLSLPDLSGDLDSQFRCLRQVQYHLEYLFDGFLQSVQEATSYEKVHKESFQVPTLRCLLHSDAALQRLLLPSSAENNGRQSYPVSCTPSAEDVSPYSQDEDPWDVACHKNTSLPSGTDVPYNGLSPSSSYADSEISSVSWCHSSEDITEKNGTDTQCTKKSCDIYKEQLASSRENVRMLTNRPAKIKSVQASPPGGSFVSSKEHVARNSRTKEVIIGQPLKIWDSQNGYIPSDRNITDKQICDTRYEYFRCDNEARQMPKHRQDVCLNKNMLQRRRYDTGMEFAGSRSARKQMPKYQPFNSQNTPMECATASLCNNSSRKHSCDTRKEHQILDWPTKQIPITEPLKLQNRRRGRVSSKKNSADKQNSDKHMGHLSFVSCAEHIPCSRAMSTSNGLETEIYSDKHVDNGGLVRPLLREVLVSHHTISSQEKPPVSQVYSDKHVINGGQVTPLLPEVLLSHRSINGQETHPVSDSCHPSFPVANGPLLENIEFGSLGPFALTFLSSKSSKATNTHTISKMSTDASALVLQRSWVGATQSRSPGFCKVGDEDEFPPLNAGIR